MELKKMKRAMAALCLALTSATIAVAQTLADTTVVTDEPLAADTVIAPTSSTSELDSLKNVVSTLQQQAADDKEQARLEKIWKRRKWWGISYIPSLKISNADNDGAEVKSDFGVNIYRGRTWYFPKKPLAGMIKIGIDASFFDVTYAKLKDGANAEQENSGETSGGDNSEYYTDEEEDFDINLGRHYINYSLAIGPSVTINPVSQLRAGLFFHYMPGVSALILDSKVSWGMQNTFRFGIHVDWSKFFLGFEGRWGSCKFSSIDTDDIDSDPEIGDVTIDDSSYDVDADYDPFENLTVAKQKMKIKQFMLTIGMRF